MKNEDDADDDYYKRLPKSALSKIVERKVNHPEENQKLKRIEQKLCQCQLQRQNPKNTRMFMI